MNNVSTPNVSGSAMPGPRTSPTIKSLQMAQRAGRDGGRALGVRGFEVRLGVSQIVILLGLTTGSMLAAFYVGLHSGQTVGFESALARMASVTPRLPIPGDAIAGTSGEEESFDAYAKLDPEAVQKGEFQRAAEAKGAVEKPVAALGFESVAAGRAATNRGDEEHESVVQGARLGVREATGESTQASKDVFSLSAAGTKTGDVSAIGSAANAADRTATNRSGLGNAGTMPELGSIKKLEREAGELEQHEPVVARGRGTEETLKAQGDRIVETKPPTQVAAVLAKTREADAQSESNVIRSITDLPAVKTDTSRAAVASATKSVNSIAPSEVAAKVQTGGPKLTVEKEKPKNGATSNGSFVREILAKGWYAQIAAPRKLPEANGLAQKLKKSGFAVVIEVAEVRGEEYFRVVVGPESSKNEGQILLQQLSRESYLSSKPFLRVVK